MDLPPISVDSSPFPPTTPPQLKPTHHGPHIMSSVTFALQLEPFFLTGYPALRFDMDKEASPLVF